jgi:hypothetical protein
MFVSCVHRCFFLNIKSTRVQNDRLWRNPVVSC